MKVYITGSLRNPGVIDLTLALEAAGFDVFSDWFAAGPEADDYWQRYEKARGRSYRDALASPAAQNVFAFDRDYLDRCDVAVMLAPAGKSAHLELGYVIGSGKAGFILMDEPGPEERWDLMLRFATGIAHTPAELIDQLHAEEDDMKLMNCQDCGGDVGTAHRCIWCGSDEP